MTLIRFLVITLVSIGAASTSRRQYACPSAIERMVPRSTFPDRVFGRRLDYRRLLEGGNRANPLADERHDLAGHLRGFSRHAVLLDEKSKRTPAP